MIFILRNVIFAQAGYQAEALAAKAQVMAAQDELSEVQSGSSSTAAAAAAGAHEDRTVDGRLWNGLRWQMQGSLAARSLACSAPQCDSYPPITMR